MFADEDLRLLEAALERLAAHLVPLDVNRAAPGDAGSELRALL